MFEEGELNKLSGIAQTLAGQIDGDSHQALYNRYPEKNAISDNAQDSLYLHIQQQLSQVNRDNQLETDIYTMVYEPQKGIFLFCVSSADKPYFRHEWAEFKPQHVEQYTDGGRIKPYSDENGVWLSSFAPIRNRSGDVVAVVQIDSKFDSFIDRAQASIRKSILISLGVFLVIAAFMVRSIRKILRKEEQLTAELVEQKRLIEEKNTDIMDSIHYAKRIQEAILPSLPKISSLLPESFIFFRPRDVVSGDFYWFAERDNHVLIAAVDCTGHGVPGAFMSMIGNTVLNEIVNQKGITEPAEILNNLDRSIKAALLQEHVKVQAKDGMDMSLVSISKDYKEIEFAGAFRPLMQSRNDELEEIRGDRFSIGGGNIENSTFTNHKIITQPGDTYYMFSDGYPDQFGGEKGKKFMNKRFKQYIRDSQHLSMQEQGLLLETVFTEWQGDHEQVDDILVIGIKVPMN